MVLDFMKGGELLTRITNSKNKYLSEQTSKLYFYQICLAVKYLHDNGNYFKLLYEMEKIIFFIYFILRHYASRLKT